MQQQAGQDCAATEAEALVPGPPPQGQLPLTLQFIPERVIDGPDGKPVLRAVVLAIPPLDPTDTSPFHPTTENWPQRARELLCEIHLHFSLTAAACAAKPHGSTQNCLTVNPLWPATDGNDLRELWQDVLYGPERNAAAQSLLPAVVELRRERRKQADAWSTIRYTQGAISAGRISNFGLAAIDEAFEGVDAVVNLLGSGKAGGSVFEVMADLFRPNPMTGEKLVPLIDDGISARIQRRGLAAAKVGVKVAGLANPFERGMDDPGPEEQASRVLGDTVVAILDEDKKAATAAYDGTFQLSAAESGFGEKLQGHLARAMANLPGQAPEPESSEAKVLINSKNISMYLAPAFGEFMKTHAADFRAIASRFLVSARSDSESKRTKVSALSQAEEDACVDEVDGPRRRLAGLLAVPALARAANIVLQVEIKLSDLPKVGIPDQLDGSFFVAALPAASTTFPFATRAAWTACELRTVPWMRWDVERERADVLTHQLFTPAEDPDLVGHARKHVTGTLDLSDGGNPQSRRYRLTSLDAASRAAGVVHSAEAETQARLSGAPADNALPPPRTAGIILLDTLAAQATQAILKRQDSGKENVKDKPDIRYACDLVTGYHADIGVKGRNSNNPLRQWRPLGRRELTFGGRDERLVKAVRDLLGSDAEAMIDRMSETIVRPSTKIVLDEDTDTIRKEAAIALETLLQWEIDPLGAACLNPDRFPISEPHTEGDDFICGGTDMIGAIEEDLPSSGPRPPRAELGREYFIGMRAVYPGGVSLSVEQAAATYGTASEGVGTRSRAYIFRRQNLPAPPVLALPESVGFEPGDKLDTLIVRTTDGPDRFDRPARRLFFVPGLPLDQASLCPLPGSSEADPRRALDDRPTIGLRPFRGAPLGGFLTVALDPNTGGLVLPGQKTKIEEREPGGPPPPRRKEVVFKVEDIPIEELGDRKMHYYPDPLVDALSFQLVDPARGGSSIGTSVELECYDRRYYQAVPPEIDARGRERCLYPHALPVVLEVRRGAESPRPYFRENDPNDFGYLDDRGSYRTLAPGKTPPPGTITVRRLVLFLAPGVEVDVQCRPWLRAGAEQYIAPLNQAQGFLARFKSALAADAGLAAFARQIASDNGVATQVKALHAVQRPNSPRLDGRLRYLRRDMSQADWPAQAKLTWPAGEANAAPPGKGERLATHQPGAATTFIGGHLIADQRVSASLSLDVTYTDMRDRPGGFDVERDGRPKAKAGDRYGVTIPVRQRGAMEARDIEIALQTEGLPDKNLMLKLPDARAYHLTLRPRSVSRFGNAIFTDPVEGRLTTTGETTDFWIDATRRPDALGYIEFLPVFVWEQRGASRRMAARLMWRANKALKSQSGRQGEAKGEWFSSGADEMLALLFADGDDGGRLKDYVTTLSSDAIRLEAPVSATDPIEYFRNAVPGYQPTKEKAFVPTPGKADPPGGVLAADAGEKLRLLAYQPRYDASGNYWYVDLDIDPTKGDIGAPWVRLGLARYQQHALSPAGYADLHCSEPSTIEFALQPRRRVEVAVERAGKRWSLTVTVFGVSGHTTGSTVHGDAGTQVPLPARAPYFRATVLRDPAFPREMFGASEVVKARVEGEGLVTAQASGLPKLWARTFELDFNPKGRDCHVFVEEFDPMMSAYDNERVLSGPRFMCRVEI